jgi:isopenicillin-N N-acyltransferase like protein
MIYHLKLEGSDPHSWGLQHGETFKKQIQELHLIRQDLLKSYLKGWSSEQIQTLCQEHVHTLENRHPSLWQELQGLSQASGVSLTDLVSLNAYTDMRDFSAGDHSRVEDGCSILAFKGPHINYVAQTWDMHASATPYMLLLELPNQTRVLTVTGCLGLAGLNSKGLSVMINNMHCRETSRQGLLWPALVRLLLNEKNVQQSFAVLEKNIPSSGHNYLLFDPSEALNVETTGLRSELTSQILPQTQGALWHTNHYVGSLKKFEILERQSPTTHKRQKAIEAFLAQSNLDSLDARSARKALFQEGALCESICIPRPKDPHGGATCGGLEIDHLTGEARAFKGLYQDNEFLDWTF